MPIMAANAQSDARGTAWLLASAAKDSISGGPEGASEWTDALNNTYRLLEAFRRNIFFGVRPPLKHRHASSDFELMTILPSGERHLAEVRDAMETALVASFAQTPKDEAVEKIVSVLRARLAPQKFQASQEDKEKATLFFTELLKQLA
jgi:hypothetical protein